MPDDTLPMQANGETTLASAATGPAAGKDDKGESGGGAYPNPHSGEPPKGGVMGHGGQTEFDEKSSGGDVKD